MGRLSARVAGVLATAALAMGLGPLATSQEVAVDPLAWRPGVGRAVIEEALRGARIHPAMRGPNALVVEVPLLSEIYAPQRALLEFDVAGALASFTLHVTPVDPGSPREVDDLYAETRALMLRRLGRPDQAREEGDRGNTAFARPVGDDWLRSVDWQTSVDWHRRATIRVGIPHLPSGELRVEVRMVAGELPPADGYWGKEF